VCLGKRLRGNSEQFELDEKYAQDPYHSEFYAHEKQCVRKVAVHLGYGT